MRFILIILLVVGCSTPPKTKFTGTYPSLQLRGLWMACFQGASTKNPGLHPQIHGIFCDCMLDLTRGRMTSEELKVRNDKNEDLAGLFTGIANECGEILNFTKKQEQPAA